HLRDETHVVIGIDLALGPCGADVWTCDLTADYVSINADYRT
ncbi:MAG: bifunctional ornithine acetyltransferase/N-acetylglutamate synthase, partial [Planctomycetes bacterium]|nr:bifunctional ornithine acetyltransferase/N-acetylglutamate synthase [Planctomycetota bacterium]